MLGTIAVLVKATPLEPGRVSIDALATARAPLTLDPIDEVGIEWAVRMAAAGAAECVTAVSIGGPEADVALRASLARGCDAAVRIAASGRSGVAATARLAAGAMRRLDAALGVFGYESFDGSSGALPGGVAAMLDRPLISRVRDIRSTGSRLQAVRDAGKGPERITFGLPAVVSFVEGAIVPRHPKLKDLLATARIEVPVIELEAADEGRPWVDSVVMAEPAAVQARETVRLAIDAGLDELLAQLERVSRDGATVT